MASIFKRKGSNNYIVEYTDHSGSRRTISGLTTKKVAEEIARKFEEDSDRRRYGVVNPKAEQYKKQEQRSIREQLKEFHEVLSKKSPRQASLVEHRVKKILTWASVKTISDLSISRIQKALSAIQEAEDLADQTLLHHVRAIKQFSKWLWRDGRCREDMLAHLPGCKVVEKKHARRALSEEEFGKLLEAAEQGKSHTGLSGQQRAMLYCLAAYSGLRANEIRTLVPADFSLEGDVPKITIRAKNAKNRRETE